jgi:hypothetical protein
VDIGAMLQEIRDDVGVAKDRGAHQSVPPAASCKCFDLQAPSIIICEDTRHH